MGISFNAEYAKSVSKDEWVKQHSHLSKDCDLSAEYDSMVPPKKIEAAAKVEAENKEEG